MSLLQDFVRVKRGLPCPICDSSDWCMLDASNPEHPSRVICPRTPSDVRWGEAGYLHELDKAKPSPTLRRRLIPSILRPRPDFSEMARKFRDAVDADRLHRLAQQLGVSVEALRLLGVGLVCDEDLDEAGVRWASHAWSFPMVDSNGRVIGLRLRLPSGRKLAIRGSKTGLFVPTAVGSGGRYYVAEGESDTAALVTLCVPALGRAGCKQGKDLVRKWLAQRVCREVVVVADNDDPGIEGALQLARHLATRGRSARVLVPPVGDIRQWLSCGATPADLEEAVLRADPVTPREGAGE